MIKLTAKFNRYLQPPPTTFRSLLNFFKHHRPVEKDQAYYLFRDDLMDLREQEDDAFMDNAFINPLLEHPSKTIKV